MINAVQIWNPDDWEVFALSLLQCRHGALKVHKIPAAHKGDFGIDYYCTDQAVAYQCYAVQEPIDIATRADRQKRKITTDLAKIVSKAAEVSQLFLGYPIKHWILLTPLHDSKDVNLHCSKKTQEFRKQKLAHLDANFEIAIHDQNSFPSSAVAAGMSALAMVMLNVPRPTDEEMNQWQAASPDLLANATHKLMKRTGSDRVKGAVAEAVRSFLEGNAILDALRSGSPDMYEKVMAAVASRSRRLSFAGPQGGPGPSAILNTEIDSLITAIKAAAPNISDDNANQIAFGTVSDWIMRCPLDFPSDAA
ncbi:hypothetical protein [Beijerinckia indica]|uniref:Uncharacterized protein n=1 Tax=Beijerinckia indica subsp. indica (strain ATCC 9039 / DSM 1715 / NCIMB 8712) TaxID=395963 RepID=B2IGM7_BEII9|nr:hypothetical protein [Beijerinckia indica]ACB95788.1 hypothetical protein Bind_2168 [Beijerinckia indica subsp. indica ATCC 9039]